MRQRLIRLAVLLVIVATALGLGRTLAAQSLTLSTTPDSTIATASGSTSVTFVVRNSSTTAVTALTFSCDAARQIACRLDPPLPPRLGAGAAAVRRLVITDSSGTVTPGIAVLRVEYRAADTPGVVTAAVRLMTGRFPKAEDAASIALAGNLDPLTERDSATIYLSLRNQTDAPLTVLPPSVKAPGFLDVQVLGDTSSVPPLGTTLLPLVVRSRERVRPGKVTLLFSVPIQWSSSGKPLQGDVVLSRDVDVAVEGAAGLLSLLGLPSLLFLPGALVLLTYMVSWRMYRSKETPVLQAASAEFVVLSVTISLLFVVVWRYILGHANYLRFFSLQDIAKLWGFSIALGFLVFVVRWAVQRWREEKAKLDALRRIPASLDRPAAVLEKLRIAEIRSIRRPRATVDGVPAKPELFYLMDYPGDATRVLVAPRIEARLDETSPEAEKLNQLIETGTLSDVVQQLDIMEKQQQVELLWAGTGTTGGVRAVLAEKVVTGDESTWVFPVAKE